MNKKYKTKLIDVVDKAFLAGYIGGVSVAAVSAHNELYMGLGLMTSVTSSLYIIGREFYSQNKTEKENEKLKDKISTLEKKLNDNEK